MTVLEDRLRTALAEAPMPATSTPDPLADLNRRVRIARTRIAAVSIAAVVAVVAAIVVPLSLIGPDHSGKQARLLRPPAPAQRWAAKDPQSVTAGGGSVWSLDDRPSATNDRYYVDQRNPATGTVEHSFRVPTPAAAIYYGLGLIWVTGGGDGAYPSAIMSTLDPSTAVVRTANLGRGYAVGSMVFAVGSAWATVDEQNLVLTITPGAHLAPVANPEPGHPVAIVHVGDELEVSSGTRLLPPFSVRTAGGPAKPVPYIAKWPILASAGHQSVWARAGDSIVREDVDAAGAVSIGRTVALSARAFDVVPTSAGGLYVSIGDDSDASEDVLYYSPKALAQSDPRPTAEHAGAEILFITADPAGGVAFATDAEQLFHWDPSSSGATR